MSVPCLAVPFIRPQSRRRSWMPAVRSSPSDALPTVLGNRSRTLILRVSSYTSMLIFPGPEADPLARKVASSTTCDTLHLTDVEDSCVLGASSSSTYRSLHRRGRSSAQQRSSRRRLWHVQSPSRAPQEPREEEACCGSKADRSATSRDVKSRITLARL
ncbi:hypothetical protein K525DRAFT_260700, partial [Schizophyllum commune Loenen D]